MLTEVCNSVYFRLCIDLMHILPPFTAEGYDITRAMSRQREHMYQICKTYYQGQNIIFSNYDDNEVDRP